ncbi:TPR-like protein [Mycena sanguinolenta]|uniref:TPR-like protein n=1 Tax=Mycena sanguinolenta TaxID=230812 RepID=A0A8H6XK17_9AGAR|nr:TPR-like protein [Mycena sanguinolenta]
MLAENVSRKFIDLINEISGQYANLNPEYSIKAGDYGVMNSKTGQFQKQGNIYESEIAEIKIIASQHPPRTGAVFEELTCAWKVKKVEFSDEPSIKGHLTKPVLQTSWEFGDHRGALLIMHQPYMTYVPDVFLHLSADLESLKGKVLAVTVYNCAAYAMYLSNDENDRIQLILCEGSSRPETTGSILSWSYKGAHGIFQNFCDGPGNYTPLLGLYMIQDPHGAQSRESPDLNEPIWAELYPPWPNLDNNGDFDTNAEPEPVEINFPDHQHDLRSLAKSLSTSFAHTGHIQDLEEAINVQRDLLVQCPAGHPDHETNLYNLAKDLETYFEQTNNLDSLEEAIGYHRFLLSCPLDHPDRRKSLIHLASALSSRFEKAGKIEDIKEAIRCDHEVLTLQFNGHANYVKALSSLGYDLQICFQATGQMEELNEAIKHHRDVLLLSPSGHAPGKYDNLMNALITRFQQTGQIEDLSEGIQYHLDALAVCPPTSPRYLPFLNNLANHFMTRFQQIGEAKDLNSAIDYHRDALAMCPDDHPSYPVILESASNGLLVRFVQGRLGKDFEEASKHNQELVKLGVTDEWTLLDDIGIELGNKFRRTWQVEDIKDAIHHHCQALLLCPTEHPARPTVLHHLANDFLTQFWQTSRREDIQNAVSANREAFELSSAGHLDRFTALVNLAESLSTLFDDAGRLEDLEEAIDHLRGALSLCPPDHDRLTLLDSLALALDTRFHETGQNKDLDEAMILHREALETCPSSHRNLPKLLNSLANHLDSRFQNWGDLKNMEEAIELHRKALALCPLGHRLRGNSLNNLANTLTRRYEQTGRFEDLSESIEYHREALSLRPLGHPRRISSLHNLASNLQTRFQTTHRIHDLEEAIGLQRDVLSVCPLGHPFWSGSLNNLANGLAIRFGVMGETADLEEAIKHNREALALHSAGHDEHIKSLTNLANHLQIRFEQTHQLEDIEEAIGHQRETLLLCPPSGHPKRTSLLAGLAKALYTRFEQTGHMEDHDEAFTLWESATEDTNSSVLDQLAAAEGWANSAHGVHHTSTINAYKTALLRLELYISIQPTLDLQHSAMVARDYPAMLSVEGASYAAASGDPASAVEMLEQGRTLLWSHLRALRTSSENLRLVHPTLADTFVAKNRELEALGVSDFQAGDSKSGGGEAFARLSTRKRLLLQDRDALISEIRSTTGFEDFLKALPFTRLQRAADEGPIIFVYRTSQSSEALIVFGDSMPMALPLPELTRDLPKCLSVSRKKHGPESRAFNDTLQHVLEQLRDNVAIPVIAQLQAHGIPEGSRIWWCPALDFSTLPFHAAGPFVEEGRKKRYLPDLYVSSYTPSLSALLAARSKRPPLTGTPRVLAIGPVDMSLPDASAEIEAIQDVLGGSSVTILAQEHAKLSLVIDQMRTHPWVHISCHGSLRAGAPLLSAFKLHGEDRLTLRDLMQANLPHAELAMLSACHTAEHTAGSVHDEVLHLAAAVQFSGFRSVCGTLWQMLDADGPVIAREFYRRMEKDSKRAGYEEAARALGLTARALRRQKGTRLEQWVNYVHIGA